MAYQGTSLAYDLTVYQSQKKQKKPELQVVGHKRRKATAMLSVRAVCSFAIVVTLVSLIVYNQVQLNEVSGSINRINSQISEMENENAEMMSVLESTMSLYSIGEEAKTRLGMNRLDKYQTVYICMQKENRIELTEHSPAQSVGQQIKATLTGAIAQVQEHLSGEQTEEIGGEDALSQS